MNTNKLSNLDAHWWGTAIGQYLKTAYRRRPLLVRTSTCVDHSFAASNGKLLKCSNYDGYVTKCVKYKYKQSTTYHWSILVEIGTKLCAFEPHVCFPFRYWFDFFYAYFVNNVQLTHEWFDCERANFHSTLSPYWIIITYGNLVGQLLLLLLTCFAIRMHHVFGSTCVFANSLLGKSHI